MEKDQEDIEREKDCLNKVDVWYLCDLVEDTGLVKTTMPHKIHEIWSQITKAYCEFKDEDSSPEALAFMDKILKRKWKNEK